MDALTPTVEPSADSTPLVAGAAGRTAAIEAFRPRARPTLSVRRMDRLETVWMTKTGAGFDRRAVEGASKVLRAAASVGGYKFLVMDFMRSGAEGDVPGEGIKSLVVDVANLILKSTVVTVAVARGPVGGEDLELALTCNILVAEEDASFCFDLDPLVSVRTYALLAQKIGFVRAERLMENGQTLTAQEMRDLLLAKEVFPKGDSAALERFLTRALRRHNSSAAIYRAQRISAPIPFENLPVAASVA